MPSANDHEYVFANAPTSAELQRLRHIDEYMGPTTERHLAARGIAAGWRCLEVGAGAGGVARWMARQVGPSGRVTAIDIAPMFAETPELPQLEVRRHDILAEGLEAKAYDLAHCRLLLVNVGNVELALRRMVEALRPGGWLVVEEAGDAKLPRVGESDPRVAEFNALTEQFLGAVQGGTTVDLNLYRRLPALMRDAGLTALGGEHLHRMVGVEGRGALLGTLAAMRTPLASTPFVTDGSMDRLVALASDPTLLTARGSTLSLWGRRGE